VADANGQAEAQSNAETRQEDVLMNTKPFYQSWTLILNAAAIVVEAYNQFAPFIPKEWEPKLAVLLAAANFILRFKTTKPIAIAGR
jgi:hypothetical protein